MTSSFEHIADLQPLVGQALGSSEWIGVDQARIDRFAEATDDHQWIHTQPALAAQGPYGGTVAHGFLTLSLLPAMLSAGFTIRHCRMAVNYGLNRVRFPAAVASGSRVRGHFRLLAFEPIEGGAQLTTEVTVLCEGVAKPVCVAEWVTRHYA